MALLQTILVCSILLYLASTSVSAQNVTKVLEEAAPVNTNFSTFNRLLSMTNVSAEINSRSSLTILVPDNSALDSFVSANLEGMHVRAVGDFCRYHILLQYLDIQEIMQMTNESGLLITTLYQTTGRAEGIDGFVNMTFGNDIQFGLPPPNGVGPVSTVLNNFVRYPYNMSFMMISKPLMPTKLGMSNHPDHFPSIPNALFKANIYKTFLKLMQDTNVQAEVENIEHQPFTDGITLFAPTDAAFQGLPSGALAALTDAQKLSLVQYHVLPSFFTFGSLRTQASPLPTLASRGNASMFLLNPTNSGPSGGLTISSGVAAANVIATILEDDPVGVYALDAVLLPPEIFPLSSSPPPSTSPLTPPVAPNAPAPVAAQAPPVPASPPPAAPNAPAPAAPNAPAPVAAAAPKSAPKGSSPPLPSTPPPSSPSSSASVPPSPPSSSSDTAGAPTQDDGSVADGPAEGPSMNHATSTIASGFLASVAAAAAAALMM